MALNLRLPAMTSKSPGPLANSTARQFFRGQSLRFRWRISANSNSLTASTAVSRCRLERNVEKVFGAKGAVYLCTDRLGVDAEELSSLLAAGNQNCEQFPRVRDDGTVVPADPAKLRRALRYSSVVVALYVEGADEHEEEFEVDRPPQVPGLPARRWLDYLKPRASGKRRLVAFGRATSDVSLTASIYDLVVAPSYQRSGYGSRVLLRIVRELRRKSICDIAVTPTPELRKFFEKCGFAPDQLNSTTMMYTRGPTSASSVANEVKEYGRKLFLIPPPLTPGTSTRILERSRL